MSSHFLIYGLKLEDLTAPFRIGNLIIYPSECFDLRDFLKSFDHGRVQSVMNGGALYAKLVMTIQMEDGTTLAHSAPDEDVALSITAMRLYRAGWIFCKSVQPHVVTRGAEFWQELDDPPLAQDWADPMTYTMSKADVEKIQSIYQALRSARLDYLGVALRRFNRSYGDWSGPDLDDCWVDLVVALESMLSRGGDGILQSMKLRGSLLLCREPEERKEIESKLSQAYSHRSTIVHGVPTDDKRSTDMYMTFENLRSMVRDVINASIDILASSGIPPQKTMAETIDEYFCRRLTSQS